MINHHISQQIHDRSLDLKSVNDQQQIIQFSQNINQRKCTDIFCIIIAVLFTLIFTIIPLALYNKENQFKANFPTDTDGKICGIIQYQGYPYVYFTRPTQINQRLCVKKCPSLEDNKLQCKPTNSRSCNFNSIEGFQVQNYQTQIWKDRNGLFCIPKDQDARKIILQKSKLQTRNIFFQSKDSYFTSSWIALFLSIIFCLLVHFFPKVVNKQIIYVSAVVVLALFIGLLASSKSHALPKVLIGLGLLVFLLVLGLTIYLYRQAVLANGQFLRQAGKLISDIPLILINIFIFLGIFALYQYVMIKLLNNYWTHSNLQFNPSQSLYWQYNAGQSRFWTFLWVIQFIWGLNFIKQSFNFIVSTYATLWYNGHLKRTQHMRQQFMKLLFPYRLYFTKHLGSVIACSFMSAFLKIPDTIFDIIRYFVESFKPQRDRVAELKDFKQNKKSHVASHQKNYVFCFLDLVRPEALAFIAATGNTYCNSARYCQYLCKKSILLQHSQSASRAFRFASYSTLAGISTFIGLFVHGNVSIYGGIFTFLICYFIVNFFVQIHADIADGVFVMFLMHQQMIHRKQHQNNNHQHGQKFSILQIKQSKNHNKTKQIATQLQYQRLFFVQKGISHTQK